MATRTIDLLLSLEAKPSRSIDELKKDLQSLEKEAKDLGDALELSLKEGSRGAPILADRLKVVKGRIQEIDREAQKRVLERNLKRAEEQANRTREKMEKLAQVGTRLAVAGAAILAPLTLALNKYRESLAEDDPMKARIDNLVTQFSEMQIRIGKIVAESIIPIAERVLPQIDKIVSFVEAHPELIKIALGAGTTLVTAGVIMTTIANVVSTIATIQGLAAGMGIGGAAAGGAAGGGALAGLGASIATAVTTAAPFVAIGVAVAAAAEATRQIVNWALGTNQTWSDIGLTLARLVVLTAEGWDRLLAVFGVEANFSRMIADALGIADVSTNKNTAAVAKSQNDAIRTGFSSFGSSLSRLAGSIGSGLSGIGSAISGALSRAFRGGQAEGGYAASAGLYMRGEAGREFVMNNSTTRAAENMIGGRLTQENMLSALSGGRRITYNDNRRIDTSLTPADRAVIRRDILDALAGAL
jgi:hypothetical protein